jgi:DNA-directed RNA polymerase specialized sigma24 family protein
MEKDVAAYAVRGRIFVVPDEALKRLAAIDPRKSQLVELRFLGGLGVKEAAEVLRFPKRR